MGETSGQPDPRFEKRLREFLDRKFLHIPRSGQLLVDMTGLEGLLGIANAVDFERRYGIPRDRIGGLERDNWFELSREHLLTLLTLESEVRRTRDDNFQ